MPLPKLLAESIKVTNNAILEVIEKYKLIPDEATDAKVVECQFRDEILKTFFTIEVSYKLHDSRITATFKVFDSPPDFPF